MAKTNLTIEETKRLLKENNVKISDISSVLNVTQSHVSNVLHRRSYSVKVARAICVLVNKPLQEVFGDV